tara:strand:- start:161 stop:469 length:309 start_codon:yes stop_codon:yes gene_type:complete
MVNKGKRIGDSKKAKQVKSITFFHNPNDSSGVPDPIQQFDIMLGVEKEKKVKPKDVFEDYHDDKKKKKKKKLDSKSNPKMDPLKEVGKKRGLEKKNKERSKK